jgi:hypothetical protein
MANGEYSVAPYAVKKHRAAPIQIYFLPVCPADKNEIKHPDANKQNDKLSINKTVII